ncbi:MAG: IPT/TIG domain-containing protein [Chloroflexi bacterium]|nr:IPT/TIG domain-containing protein [Chloroflexota bacterium]
MSRHSPLNYLFRLFLILAAVIILSAGIGSLAYANEAALLQPDNNGTPFYSLNGVINPGATLSPTYFQSGGSRAANFALTISSGAVPVPFQVRDSANALIWADDVEPGETVWGTVVLTPGVNQFTLHNPGGQAANFSLNFYDLPAVPFTWQGKAAPTGVNSQAKLIFAHSGLYSFDFGVNANGRYEFALDNNYLQKTVVANSTAVFYVTAGVHTLTISQSAAGGSVDWSVAIAYTGQAADSLPYQKSSSAIVEEWLPVYLAAAAQTNLVLTATGAPGDSLQVAVNEVRSGGTAVSAAQTVQTGETTWMTLDLPAGLSLIHLTAVGGPVNYSLSLNALPTAAYTWSGQANASGAHSNTRVQFPTSGLYTFDFAVNGRYQFLLDVGSAPFIQKTVESGSDDVVYYVPAGTHALSLVQDTAVGADWSVSVSLLSAGANSLPYAKAGGHLGGAGNDFAAEWLPLALDAAATVNLSLSLSGAANDSLRLEVYQAGSATPSFVSPDFMGTEKGWMTFELSAGANRLRLISGSNNGPLAYTIQVTAVPQASATTWDGFSLAGTAHSVIMVNFPASGLYRFSLEAASGFANLVLDDALNLRGPQASSDTTYDMMVTAGWHEVVVLQDAAYPAADWTASIAATTAGESFFTFDGVLAPGESVTPLYTVPSGSLDFNFALAVSGADVDLALTNGSSSVVWDGRAFDGETVWGTGLLTGQNSIQLSNNDTTTATISLVFYYIPSAGYTWDGLAAAVGENSHIRLIFPQSGLYSFANGVDNGRYQFRLTTNHTNHIRKTAETDTNVTYYVPAGMHDLYLEQDSGLGANWDVVIGSVGASADSLPYARSGGALGGVGNDFSDEWLPIHLGQATAVNLSIAINGAAADALRVDVLNANGSLIDSVTVYGQETTWRTLDLSADARVYLRAAIGNSAAVNYSLSFRAIPQPNTSWSGVTAADGAASQVRVNFPNAGLYTFGLGQNSGRYQLLVNDEFIQKTVEDDTAVTYFVPAGVHNLVVDQDSAVGAAWNVVISGPTADNDALPYTKVGGQLGGDGNDFSQEWLPIHVGAEMLANVVITITGSAADAVSLQLWDAVTTTTTLPAIYGTETVWTAVTLPADARLRLVAAGGNAAAVSYQIAIQAIPQPAYAWSGVSLENGLHSNILVDLSLAGTYQLAVVMDEGFTNFDISPYPPTRIANSSSYTVTFSRPAGLYSFTSLQSAGYARTTWQASLSLLSAEAPTLTAVTPEESNVGQVTAVTLTGSNFMAGLTVDLVQGAATYALDNVLVISATQVLADVPGSVPEGIYTVRLTNPDTQTAVLTNGFTVYGAQPNVTGVSPNRVKINSLAVVTITGSNFLNGATVTLAAGSANYPLENVVWLTAGELTAVVPGSVPVGTYDVVVTNPNSQSGQLAGGLTVEAYTLHLPLIVK